MNGRAWSAEDDTRLRALVLQDMGPVTIAAAMGRTRNAVLGRACRLGLFFPKAAKHARMCEGVRIAAARPGYREALSRMQSAAWARDPARRERARLYPADRNLIAAAGAALVASRAARALVVSAAPHPEPVTVPDHVLAKFAPALLTPAFREQLARVYAGVPVIANTRVRAPLPARTLGGVASYGA